MVLNLALRDFRAGRFCRAFPVRKSSSAVRFGCEGLPYSGGLEMRHHRDGSGEEVRLLRHGVERDVAKSWRGPAMGVEVPNICIFRYFCSGLRGRESEL